MNPNLLLLRASRRIRAVPHMSTALSHVARTNPGATHQPAAARLMRGLGSSIYPGNVDYPAFDEAHWVAPNEAVWAARTLAASYHASGGWSVGAVALVAGWVARTSAPGTRVAAIFPDGPMRYHGTIYDDDFCRSHDLLDRPPAQEPDVIDHSSDRVVDRWTRLTHVIDPLGRTA